MSKWQPIETAPKDGTHILALFDEGIIEAWYWVGVRSDKSEYGHEWLGINLPQHGCGCCASEKQTTYSLDAQTTGGIMILRSARDWPSVMRFIERLKEQPIPESGWEFIWREVSPDRSLDQNAKSHVWYGQVAKVEKEYTAEDIKRRCKYHFGIPILREDAEASYMIEKFLGHLSYEERLKAMDHIKVTSVLDKDQMSRYMMAVQQHYDGRVDLR